MVLVVFTVYVPKNSGLAQYNYLVKEACFPDEEINLVEARAEKIPVIVDLQPGFGWTGSDLFADYLCTKRTDLFGSLPWRYEEGKFGFRMWKYVDWPDATPPRLCLVGPEENSLKDYFGKNDIRLAVPTKYSNLTLQYLRKKEWNPQLFFFPGKVEKQVRAGRADIAIDIVRTGRTLEEECLQVYDTLYKDTKLVLFAGGMVGVIR